MKYRQEEQEIDRERDHDEDRHRDRVPHLRRRARPGDLELLRHRASFVSSPPALFFLPLSFSLSCWPGRPVLVIRVACTPARLRRSDRGLGQWVRRARRRRRARGRRPGLAASASVRVWRKAPAWGSESGSESMAGGGGRWCGSRRRCGRRLRGGLGVGSGSASGFGAASAPASAGSASARSASARLRRLGLPGGRARRDGAGATRFTGVATGAEPSCSAAGTAVRTRRRPRRCRDPRRRSFRSGTKITCGWLGSENASGGRTRLIRAGSSSAPRQRSPAVAATAARLRREGLSTGISSRASVFPVGRMLSRRPGRGVANGTRTRDHRDHNPGLYQLSYRHLDGQTG